jgi:hypothetical protein
VSFSENTLTVRGTILGSIDGIGSAYSADRNDTIAGVVPPRKGPSSALLHFNRSTYVFNALLETQGLLAATAELPPNPIKLWSSNDKTNFENFVLDTMPPDELEVLSEWIDANRWFITFGVTLEFWNGI